jgi:hypothetical protein
MAIQYSTTHRNNNMADVTTDVGTTGYILIYSGSAPANCGTAASGTLLVSIPLANPIAPAAFRRGAHPYRHQHERQRSGNRHRRVLAYVYEFGGNDGGRSRHCGDLGRGLELRGRHVFHKRQHDHDYRFHHHRDRSISSGK